MLLLDVAWSGSVWLGVARCGSGWVCLGVHFYHRLFFFLRFLCFVTGVAHTHQLLKIVQNYGYNLNCSPSLNAYIF